MQNVLTIPLNLTHNKENISNFTISARKRNYGVLKYSAHASTLRNLICLYIPLKTLMLWLYDRYKFQRYEAFEDSQINSVTLCINKPANL